MMKKLTIIGSLVALFIFGGVCGFAVAVGIVKRSLNEAHFVQQRMAEESKRLKLTPEQIERAGPSYEQMKQDMVKVKSDAVLAITEAAIKQGRDLAALLTPEQLSEFRKLTDERRARFEKKAKP